jgi:hypothetical protein
MLNKKALRSKKALSCSQVGCLVIRDPEALFSKDPGGQIRCLGIRSSLFSKDPATGSPRPQDDIGEDVLIDWLPQRPSWGGPVDLVAALLHVGEALLHV